MRKRILALVLVTFGMMTAALAGEAYIGAGVGKTGIKDSEQGITFDETDNSFKIYGGFRFLKFFGVEGSYVDLGAPSDTIAGDKVTIDTTAWDAFAVGVLPLGFLEIFGKVGMVAWDADIDVSGAISGSDSDSGTDPAYGVGVAFKLGKLFAIRAEYERFDIEDTDKVDMVSVGLDFRF